MINNKFLVNKYRSISNLNPFLLFSSKQICEINESPIFLKLNPLSRQTDVSIIAAGNENADS